MKSTGLNFGLDPAKVLRALAFSKGGVLPRRELLKLCKSKESLRMALMRLRRSGFIVEAVQITPMGMSAIEEHDYKQFLAGKANLLLPYPEATPIQSLPNQSLSPDAP